MCKYKNEDSSEDLNKKELIVKANVNKNDLNCKFNDNNHRIIVSEIKIKA